MESVQQQYRLLLGVEVIPLLLQQKQLPLRTIRCSESSPSPICSVGSMADRPKKTLKLFGHDINPEAEASTVAAAPAPSAKFDAEAEKELSTEADIQGHRAESEEQAEASEMAHRKRNRGHDIPSTSQIARNTTARAAGQNAGGLDPDVDEGRRVTAAARQVYDVLSSGEEKGLSTEAEIQGQSAESEEQDVQSGQIAGAAAQQNAGNLNPNVPIRPNVRSPYPSPVWQPAPNIAWQGPVFPYSARQPHTIYTVPRPLPSINPPIWPPAGIVPRAFRQQYQGPLPGDQDQEPRRSPGRDRSQAPHRR
ncbi:hypothetical protein GOP47_0011235 [Adiantum capillus-veneris]|uniref:Uncharacterized protein n=1 Tax=Adiantum capillus-veneris TaxID=13818 RepID=A0A9D4ZGJ0_ADICA|nr:hypothetical protein GOP47_0011235 [Adiantum capillus-veneris]